MVFQCQHDSFQQELITRVEQIEEKNGLVEVIFKDTVFFPEGGGQPFDTGYFVKTSDDASKYEVKNVCRRGNQAVHIIERSSDLKVDDEVKQVINWERRHDHMQQHSGQHLITALFERKYDNKTKAWWLGADSSYIELEKNVDEVEMKEIEKLCNEYIAMAIPVNVKIYDSCEEAGSDVTRASRGLPDLAGPLRVVQIGDIDKNMCCGTHVTNLAQLQVIKLMNVEKTKNKVLLHFLVGNRVISKLETCFKRELTFNSLLNNGPDDHVDLVKKMQATIKSSQKTIQRVSKELAVSIAEKLNQADPTPDYYFMHRTDGVDMDFLNGFLRALKTKKSVFIFITISDAIDSKSGTLILMGNQEDLDELANEIITNLDGKGNCKNGRFQGKANNFKKIKDCEKLIKKHFESKK